MYCFIFVCWMLNCAYQVCIVDLIFYRIVVFWFENYIEHNDKYTINKNNTENIWAFVHQQPIVSFFFGLFCK